MKTEKFILTASGQDFIFSIRSLDHEPPHLQVSLHRKDSPHIKWDWDGNFLAHEKIEFKMAHRDNIHIKGHLRLFQSRASGEKFVFMDAAFGLNHEEHFSGNIMEITETPNSPVQEKPTQLN